MTTRIPATFIAVASLLLTLGGCGQGSDSMHPAPMAIPEAASAMTEASYREAVKTLSSDEFGGRAPASPGEELTVNFLVDAFKSLGLQGANNGDFVQAVPLSLVMVNNDPALTIRGGSAEPMSLAYGDDQILFTRRQGAGAGIENSEMVFVGYGINAPERNWNDYAHVDVRGKTVVMLVNDPGYATQDPELFNGNSMTYYGRWDYKFDEAARQGAAGAIIIHDTKPAAYPWSTVQNSWSGPQFDIVRNNLGEDLAAVEGWIQKDKARRLFARAGLDLDAMYEAARRPGFRARPMGMTASASLKTDYAEVVSRNVAAILPGSEAPDEVFIYMAHWDHLGTDDSLEGDQVYNGALDNATGTAGLIELARAFTSLEKAPRRSIVFLAVAAEEQGLLGSYYYAAHPLFPFEQTVAGLNMDGLNVIGRTRDVTVVGYGFSELDAILETAAKQQDRELAADREAEKGYYFRSDHFALAKRGVPMLYPNAGYDHREKGLDYGMSKSAEYVANHYHGVTDEYSEDWDVSGAMEDLVLYFLTGLAIADGDAWPNWNEGTEFKAARDAQRGQ